MNRIVNCPRLCQLIIGLLLSLLLLAGCIQSRTTVTTESKETPESPTTTTASPSQNPEATIMTPQGKTIIITSPADNGQGTLRQALSDAQSGDTITFDTTIFPPTAPATIYINSELPTIRVNNLTIDASNAGVILDGSDIVGDCITCLHIVSDGNVVQGLQLVNFPKAGISLNSGAQYNLIGGDRRIGSGPLGQGNLISRGGGTVIVLGGNNTSFNTISGNLIGTDTTGGNDWGSGGCGIWIDNMASHNTIGPDNIIAYNNNGGIIILNGSIGNTITQNSIYYNRLEDIKLRDGGNIQLNAPSIIDFDLAKGTVAGKASANCIIEIFSDSSNEGRIYEGHTVTNDIGAFTFSKGTSFIDDHLTTTATDADGNTSGFSEPTLGASSTVIFQEGNNLLKTQLQSKQSKELEYNRIGHMECLTDVVSDSSAKSHIYQVTEQFGFKLVRLSLDWFDWREVIGDFPLDAHNPGQELVIGDYSEKYVNPYQDQTITSFVENGVKIRYCLVFWDKAIQAGEGYSRFKTEDEIQRYLDYVRFIVQHFKGQIEYYELLNEWDFGVGTQQYVEVADYIKLVKRVVPVIRQENPEAKIVIGALTPLSMSGARDKLFTILNADVMPLVDGISWHCHNMESPENMPKFYYGYPSLVQQIKDVASAHGFHGEYIAEELHWRSIKSPFSAEGQTYDWIVSAKYYGRGIVMNLGMDLTTEIAVFDPTEVPFMVRVSRNLCTLMAGAKPSTVSMTIQSPATNIRSYSFSMSDGSQLIVLWTDGVAVDDDLGVKSTVTIQNISAQKVTGIDVLYSFEQFLVVSSEGTNLVIRDLLIKDYPIFLRLVP